MASELFGADFVREFCDYCAKYDALAESRFTGDQLDKLSAEFLDKHEPFLEAKFGFKSTRGISSNTNELMAEDRRIILEEHCEEDTQFKHLAPADRLAALLEATDPKQLLADLYRRACQACYLRITLNKSRKKQEDNRLEAVQLGRQAIRFHANSFPATHWYLISLGWYLEPIVNPRERAHVSQLFKDTALRAAKLDPGDGLAPHLLGIYYYNVARLSWIELTVARGLLNSKLSGTFEDAERELMRAHELVNRSWPGTGLWMARLLQAQKKPADQVKRWIDHGLACAAKEPTDELEREELLELRSKLKIKN